MQPKYKKLVLYGIASDHKQLKAKLVLKNKSISQWFREKVKEELLTTKKR